MVPESGYVYILRRQDNPPPGEIAVYVICAQTVNKARALAVNDSNSPIWGEPEKTHIDALGRKSAHKDSGIYCRQPA